MVLVSVKKNKVIRRMTCIQTCDEIETQVSNGNTWENTMLFMECSDSEEEEIKIQTKKRRLFEFGDGR